MGACFAASSPMQLSCSDTISPADAILAALPLQTIHEQQESINSHTARAHLPLKIWLREWMRVDLELKAFDRELAKRQKGERKRAEAAQRQQKRQIDALKVPCSCQQCRGLAKCPSYYTQRVRIVTGEAAGVVTTLFQECYWEFQDIEPGTLDRLAREVREHFASLMPDRPMHGSAIMARRRERKKSEKIENLIRPSDAR
jgi:hypothetical protein